MSEEDNLSRYRRLPQYDRELEKFQIWLVYLGAYPTVCGFKAAIGRESKFPELLDPSNNTGKKKLPIATALAVVPPLYIW